MVSAGTPLLVGNFTLKVGAFGNGLEPSEIVRHSYGLPTTMSAGTVVVGSNFTIAGRPDGAVYAWPCGRYGSTR